MFGWFNRLNNYLVLYIFLTRLPFILQWLTLRENRGHLRSTKWWDNFDRDRIVKFVYDEFPEIKQVEDQPSMPDFLKGKSPEELAKICKFAAQASAAASASASAKSKSPAKSSASSTPMGSLIMIP